MDGRSPESLEDLLQEYGGLCAGHSAYFANADELKIAVRTTHAGDIGALWPEIANRGDGLSAARGTGSGLTDEEALIPALGESVERYSTCVAHAEQFVWATAKELGDDALDLDTVPRCSTAELAHPRCPLVAPSKSKRIRWVRGLLLDNGHPTYIPAVMVYSHLGFAAPSERFWLPISTGCAAHLCYEKAVLSAIYEVIERDAISITWLQELPLPKIDLDYIPSLLEPYSERYDNASKDIQYSFFDATTDLGVPTVYGIQVARYNEAASTLVACSTGASMTAAVAKVIRDIAALRLAFRKQRTAPNSYDEFTDPLHGAAYMARAGHMRAFNFLLHSGNNRPLSEVRSSPLSLREILRTLAEKNLHVYAVDLSTDEAVRCGVRVVRAIIPGLQPLSFWYRARYLGHRRLYEAPCCMGYRTRTEQELNAWPQPFA